jgi:hypothetical protein
MIYKIVGKMLFPNQPLWQQRRSAKSILLAAIVGLIFGAVVILVVLYQDRKF